MDTGTTSYLELQVAARKPVKTTGSGGHNSVWQGVVQYPTLSEYVPSAMLKALQVPTLNIRLNRTRNSYTEEEVNG